MKKLTYFLTGGTGSFSKKMIQFLLKKKLAKKIIIFSRDEHKQIILKNTKLAQQNLKNLRFFIGDIRDKDRLRWSLSDDIDVVLHSAALKQVPATEHNPFETVKTNILGSQNLIEVCLEKNIKKCCLISTDKAVSPHNLYGATKLTAEKLFINANLFKGKRRSIFSVVRYGNVMGSRGSVIPFFLKQDKNENYFTVTDKRMTRFNITLNDAINFVFKSVNAMKGAEIFVPKIPSYSINEVAKSINKNKKIKIIGIRQGEKIHEELMNSSESIYATTEKNRIIIRPLSKIQKHKRLFSYNSFENENFLSAKEIDDLIKKNLKDFEA